MNIITEADRRHILGLYDRKYDHPENYLKERLAECKFTLDGKFVLFEDNIYSCETGDMVPLTERWTWSDTFHAIGDVLSAGLDFVIPGSGAVIDTLNALSYVIEAQFKKDPKEKTMLYVMGAMTFAFVIIPGALQAAAVPLKYFIKTGKGGAKPLVKKGIAIIGKSMSRILLQVPKLVSRAINTGLGRRIIGKRGVKTAVRALDNFAMDADLAVARALGTKNADELAELAKLNKAKKAAYVDDLAAAGGNLRKMKRMRSSAKWNKAGQKIGRGLGKLTTMNAKSMKLFFKQLPHIVRGKYVMKKFGFASGKTYGYLSKGGKTFKATIVRGMGDGVLVKFVGKPGTTQIPINRFIQGTIGRPWALKAYSVSVPLFVKSFARVILPDGSGLNQEAMEAMPDLNPDQTSLDSLGWLHDELVEYEGDLGAYTVNTTVTSFQNALVMLGYTLPRYGVDGKFGPETQEVLKRFQTDTELASSMGKMDRLTADRLALELKDKGVPNSEEIQNTLNSI